MHDHIFASCDYVMLCAFHWACIVCVLCVPMCLCNSTTLPCMRMPVPVCRMLFVLQTWLFTYILLDVVFSLLPTPLCRRHARSLLLSGSEVPSPVLAAYRAQYRPKVPQHAVYERMAFMPGPLRKALLPFQVGVVVGRWLNYEPLLQ